MELSRGLCKNVATVTHGTIGRYLIAPSIVERPLAERKPGIGTVAAHGIYRGSPRKDADSDVVDVDNHGAGTMLMVAVWGVASNFASLSKPSISPFKWKK